MFQQFRSVITDYDYGGVHTNSSIINKVAYK
ncbi:M4 family metallopeptidase [Bacillus wiedmannii]